MSTSKPSRPPLHTSTAGNRGAAVGDNSGAVITGNHNQVDQRTVVLPPGALRAAVADGSVARVTNLPALDSEVFRGREEALARLAALPADGTGLVAQTVRGMGGVGKSTLALHHAHRFYDRGGGPVWWLDAERQEQVTAGLAQLAAALAPVYAKLPLEDAAQWVVTWLQGRTGWLLVLDNVEDPAGLRDLLGRLHTGQVLITTRRDLPCRTLGTVVRLDTLSPRDSLAVLQDLTDRHRADDAPVLAQLAAELGHLPLALQQAGAYLAQTRTHPATYLEWLRTDPARALDTAAPGDPHQRTITRLWDLTLRALDRTNPDAVALLRILAHYAPEPLPRDVLTPALPDPHAVDQALGLLAAYSLITLTETTVTVHRLVQTVVRTTIPAPSPPPRPSRLGRLRRRTPADTPHPRNTALALLNRAAPTGSPEDVGCWPRWHSLLAHIRAVAGHHDDTDPHPQAAGLWGRTACHLRARGQATAALPLAERALTITQRTCGPHHPTTARHLGNLAALWNDLGRHTDALPLTQRALAIAEQNLGPDHPDTAARLADVATTLKQLGRHTDALSMEERALAVTEHALGPDHPDTATRLGNLAYTLNRLGRHTDALPLARRALTITEHTLGPHHPNTATRLGNLAHTLSALGRHTDALPLEQRALALTEQTLGPDHPDTALCLKYLAGTLGELGRHHEALPLTERALAIAEHVLGPDHPTTATCLNNVAYTLNRLGRHTDALPLARRALTITEHTLGPDHPTTAICLRYLAGTLGELGRHHEALPLAERALAVAERALGPAHPDTAEHRKMLGHLRHRTRDGDDHR